MRSTATHVAWSMYVSVCCRVTSVSPAKNDWIDRVAVWVWRNKAQGTIMVLGGSWISHAREKALLGNVNTWANSDLLAVDIINQFTKRQQRRGLWLQLSWQLVYFAVLVVLFIVLFWWLATWNRHSQHLQILKTETDRLSINLSMAVAKVLETRITRHERKGQKSQNYFEAWLLSTKWKWHPIKDNIVAKNWAKN